MFSEFIFQNLINDLEQFDLEVTAFRKMHNAHMGIVIEPCNTIDVFEYIEIILDIVKSYGLLATHVVCNDDSYLFECIYITNFGAN